MARRERRHREALEGWDPTFVKLGQFLSQRPDIATETAESLCPCRGNEQGDDRAPRRGPKP